MISSILILNVWKYMHSSTWNYNLLMVNFYGGPYTQCTKIFFTCALKFNCTQQCFSVHNNISQCTTIFTSAQQYFISAQKYFPVHNNILSVHNNIFRVHRYFFQHTVIFFVSFFCLDIFQHFQFPTRKNRCVQNRANALAHNSRS